MLKSSKLILLGLLLAASFAISAQKALDKPVDQWSQKEATEILNNSAWAQIHHSIEGAAAASASAALKDQADNSIRVTDRSRSERVGAPPPVVLRLHSGLPIRLALLRLNQIGAGYDKLDTKARADFDAAGKRLLDCAACQGYYVVSLTMFPNASGQSVEEGIFQGYTTEQMKGNVFLRNDKGETRPLVQFIPPAKRGDSAVFFFARKDDKGKELLSKDNSEFSFVFEGNFLTPTNRFAHLLPRKFDFRVSKITVSDRIVF